MKGRLALHWQILIGMALGAAAGLSLNALAARGAIDPATAATAAEWGKGAGDLFLRLLSMMVAPLILTSLVAGITSTGSLKGLGRMGALTFGFYIVTGFIAILTGILLVNLIQPGVGAQLVPVAEQIRPEILARGGSVAQVMWEQVQRLVPKNPFAALADPDNGSILAVIFFALLFGVFIVKVGGAAGKLLGEVFGAAFEVMMALISFVIRLAPLGVCGFMLAATAGQGLDVFKPLLLYMLTVFLALAAHGLITLPLVLRFVALRRPGAYARQMAPALLTAFSTASSNATLPLTLSCSEQRAGIPNRFGSFVLPIGASINTDGTALYEAVAVLFIAQVYGIQLDLAQQAIVAFTALLAGIGAAGVPHAGLVMMVVVLKAVGLPLDAVGLILAVDRVLDMCRTTLNVWGDCSAIAIVHRFAGGPRGEPPAENSPAQPAAAPAAR